MSRYYKILIPFASGMAVTCIVWGFFSQPRSDVPQSDVPPQPRALLMPGGLGDSLLPRLGAAPQGVVQGPKFPGIIQENAPEQVPETADAPPLPGVVDALPIPGVVEEPLIDVAVEASFDPEGVGEPPTPGIVDNPPVVEEVNEPPLPETIDELPVVEAVDEPPLPGAVTSLPVAERE
jgi:hypothetical protein